MHTVGFYAVELRAGPEIRHTIPAKAGIQCAKSIESDFIDSATDDLSVLDHKVGIDQVLDVFQGVGVEQD